MEEQHELTCRSCYIQTSQVLACLRARVEDTSRLQMLLATSRMQLLVKRESLRSAGKEVKAKRVAAGDAESALMGKLRIFIHEHWSELPSGILEAYDSVEQSRNVLGVVEEEYLQEERELAGEEWKAMDQENKFYQFDLCNTLPARSDYLASVQKRDDRTILFPPHPLPPPPPPPPPPPFHLSAHQRGPLNPGEIMMLPPPPPPPPPPPISTYPSSFATELCSQKVPSGRYRTLAKEVNKLKNAFDQLRKEQAHDVRWAVGDEVLFSDGLGLPCDDPKASLTLPVLKGLEILEKLHSREVAAQKIDPQGGSIFDGLPTKLRRNSDAAHCPQSGVPCTAPMRRTQTESAVSRLNENPTMREKIGGWSFEYMRMNIVEQKHYLNALEKEGVRDSMDVDWKERAALFWGIDSGIGGGEENKREASSAGIVSLGAKLSNEEMATASLGAPASPQDEEGFDESDLDYDDYDGTSVVFIPLESHSLRDEAAAIPLPPSPPPLHEPGDELEPSIPYVIVTLDQIPSSEEQSVHLEDVPVQCNTLEQPLSGLSGSHDISLRKDSCREDDEIQKDDKKTHDPYAQHGSLQKQATVTGNVLGTVASSERRESMPQPTTKNSFTVSEVVTEGMNTHNHPITPEIKIETLPRDKVLCTSPPSPPKSQRRKSAGTILRNMKTRVLKGKIGRSKSTPDVNESRSLSNT